mmetsp:Transcript_71981/g.120402  ORF Transcript_71981/g.120402 Transcript_71981/m.120402 type:complete len:406 (-) Transcript_71981:579-1796(-)
MAGNGRACELFQKGECQARAVAHPNRVDQVPLRLLGGGVLHGKRPELVLGGGGAEVGLAIGDELDQADPGGGVAARPSQLRPRLLDRLRGVGAAFGVRDLIDAGQQARLVKPHVAVQIDAECEPKHRHAGPTGGGEADQRNPLEQVRLQFGEVRRADRPGLVHDEHDVHRQHAAVHNGVQSAGLRDLLCMKLQIVVVIDSGPMAGGRCAGQALQEAGTEALVAADPNGIDAVPLGLLAAAVLQGLRLQLVRVERIGWTKIGPAIRDHLNDADPLQGVTSRPRELRPCRLNRLGRVGPAFGIGHLVDAVQEAARVRRYLAVHFDGCVEPNHSRTGAAAGGKRHRLDPRGNVLLQLHEVRRPNRPRLINDEDRVHGQSVTVDLGIQATRRGDLHRVNLQVVVVVDAG